MQPLAAARQAVLAAVHLLGQACDPDVIEVGALSHQV
jgi:hypothetical protein